MEGLTLAHLGTLAAFAFGLVALIRSFNKDQGDTDKVQDSRIANVEGDVKAIKVDQVAVKERVSAVEGAQKTLDSKLAREIEKLEKKVEQLDKNSRQDMRELMELVGKLLKP